MDHDELPDNGERGQERSSAEKRESHHRHRHHRLLLKRRWLVSPLWITIFLEAIVIVGLIIWGILLEQDHTASSERERSVGLKLKEAQAELEGLKYDINEKGSAEQEACLPKTVSLKLEQFLDVNREYVKRAFFVLAGKKENRILEYKIVLKNDTKINVVPKFDIVFFNTAGNAVGTAKFGYHDDGSPSKKVLEKGEVRSINGTFDVSNMPLPELFMIKTFDE